MSDDVRDNPDDAYNASPAMHMMRYLEKSCRPPHPFVWTSNRQCGKHVTTFTTLLEFCKRSAEPVHVGFGGMSDWRRHMFRQFETRLRDAGWWLEKDTTADDPATPVQARWRTTTFSHPAYQKVLITSLPQSDKDFGAADMIVVMRYSGREHIERVNGRVIVLLDSCFVDPASVCPQLPVRPPVPFFQDTRHYPPPPWHTGGPVPDPIV